MVLKEGEEPDAAMMKEIRGKAAELAALALERKK